MKIVTKRGELPIGAHSKIAKAVGVSTDTVKWYERNGFPRNKNGINVKNNIEENYPEFFSGTKIYILSVRTVFGKRLVLAACLKDDLDEMKKKMADADIDVTVEEYVIGEVTPEAMRTFFPDETPVWPTKPEGHRIEGYIPHTRSGGVLMKILLSLGCETVEDATKVSVEQIMSYPSATRRTLYDLSAAFDKLGLPYNEKEFRAAIGLSEEEKKKKAEIRKKYVGKFDKEGNLLESWNSPKDAALALRKTIKYVEERCEGISEQEGDFVLKYIE